MVLKMGIYWVLLEYLSHLQVIYMLVLIIVFRNLVIMEILKLHTLRMDSVEISIWVFVVLMPVLREIYWLQMLTMGGF